MYSETFGGSKISSYRVSQVSNNSESSTVD